MAVVGRAPDLGTGAPPVSWSEPTAMSIRTVVMDDSLASHTAESEHTRQAPSDEQTGYPLLVGPAKVREPQVLAPDVGEAP